MNISKEPQKKHWVTPKLVVHGDVAKITEESPVAPKKFGASDGVIASAHDVHLVS